HGSLPALRSLNSLSSAQRADVTGQKHHQMLGLGQLGSVLRPRLLAVFNTASIKSATNNVIANTREILHPAAADQHNAVLLQIMSFTRNVRRNFDAARQTNAGNLAQCRIGLLGRHGLDLRAHASLLRRVVRAAEGATVASHAAIGVAQGWALGLLIDALAALANQLIDRRHEKLLFVVSAIVLRGLYLLRFHRTRLVTIDTFGLKQLIWPWGIIKRCGHQEGDHGYL